MSEHDSAFVRRFAPDGAKKIGVRFGVNMSVLRSEVLFKVALENLESTIRYL
jgi:hypothetical protein